MTLTLCGCAARVKRDMCLTTVGTPNRAAAGPARRDGVARAHSAFCSGRSVPWSTGSTRRRRKSESYSNPATIPPTSGAVQ